MVFRRKDPVTKAKNVGAGVQGVTFSALPEWMQGGLGLQVEQVPSRLVLPNITPVVEIYRHKPRFIIPDDVAGPVPNFTIEVPDGVEWLFQSMSFLVQTDANVADRQLFFRALLIGGGTGFGVTTGDYFVTSADFLQTASTIVSYTIGPTGVAGNVLAAALPGTRDAIVQAPTPIGLTFFGGSQLVVILQNGAIGDTITGIGLSVWERRSPNAYER